MMRQLHWSVTNCILVYNTHALPRYMISTGWLKKSKLLILAVNEINASQTRVSFAKFIPKLVEKMFDVLHCSELQFFNPQIFY